MDHLPLVEIKAAPPLHFNPNANNPNTQLEGAAKQVVEAVGDIEIFQAPAAQRGWFGHLISYANPWAYGQPSAPAHTAIEENPLTTSMFMQSVLIMPTEAESEALDTAMLYRQLTGDAASKEQGKDIRVDIDPGFNDAQIFQSYHGDQTQINLQPANPLPVPIDIAQGPEPLPAAIEIKEVPTWKTTVFAAVRTFLGVDHDPNVAKAERTLVALAFMREQEYANAKEAATYIASQRGDKPLDAWLAEVADKALIDECAFQGIVTENILNVTNGDLLNEALKPLMKQPEDAGFTVALRLQRGEAIKLTDMAAMDDYTPLLKEVYADIAKSKAEPLSVFPTAVEVKGATDNVVASIVNIASWIPGGTMVANLATSLSEDFKEGINFLSDEVHTPIEQEGTKAYRQAKTTCGLAGPEVQAEQPAAPQGWFGWTVSTVTPAAPVVAAVGLAAAGFLPGIGIVAAAVIGWSFTKPSEPVREVVNDYAMNGAVGGLRATLTRPRVLLALARKAIPASVANVSSKISTVARGAAVPFVTVAYTAKNLYQRKEVNQLINEFALVEDDGLAVPEDAQKPPALLEARLAAYHALCAAGRGALWAGKAAGQAVTVGAVAQFGGMRAGLAVGQLFNEEGREHAIQHVEHKVIGVLPGVIPWVPKFLQNGVIASAFGGVRRKIISLRR